MGVPDPHRDSQFYDGVVLRRFVAFWIDLVVMCVLWVLVAVVGLVFTVMSAGIGAPLAFLAFAATSVLYRFVLLRERSATVGMIVTGLEVRAADGARVDPATAFWHTALYHLTGMLTPLLVIGWVLMLTSPYRRAMHDLFLGTVVINRPS